jgi:hypothetical protein
LSNEGARDKGVEDIVSELRFEFGFWPSVNDSLIVEEVLSDRLFAVWSDNSVEEVLNRFLNTWGESGPLTIGDNIGEGGGVGKGMAKWRSL